MCIGWPKSFRARRRRLTPPPPPPPRRYLFLIAPSAALALLTTHKYTALEVLWTFSIYLEAVAILPQLILLQRTNNIDNLTGNYVALLGCVRVRACVWGGGVQQAGGRGGAARRCLPVARKRARTHARARSALILLPAPVRAPSTYRGLYIINWVYRYWTEHHYRQWVGEQRAPTGGGRPAGRRVLKQR